MIIGIIGAAHSGKSKIAEFIDEEFGDVAIVSFADPIKEFARDVFDFSPDQVYGNSKEAPDKRYPRVHNEPTGSYKTYLTPRYAMQRLGTEWGRDCYPDIWVDYAMRRADKILTRNEAQLVVIPDVRFVNEAVAIQDRGGKIWKAVRKSAEPVNAHVSETEHRQIEADLIFDNNGTLDELRDRVFQAVKELNHG